jgi:hypothetical protein
MVYEVIYISPRHHPLVELERGSLHADHKCVEGRHGWVSFVFEDRLEEVIRDLSPLESTAGPVGLFSPIGNLLTCSPLA